MGWRPGYVLFAIFAILHFPVNVQSKFCVLTPPPDIFDPDVRICGSLESDFPIWFYEKEPEALASKCYYGRALKRYQGPMGTHETGTRIVLGQNANGRFMWWRVEVNEQHPYSTPKKWINTPISKKLNLTLDYFPPPGCRIAEKDSDFEPSDPGANRDTIIHAFHMIAAPEQKNSQPNTSAKVSNSMQALSPIPGHVDAEKKQGSVELIRQKLVALKHNEDPYKLVDSLISPAKPNSSLQQIRKEALKSINNLICESVDITWKQGHLTTVGKRVTTVVLLSIYGLWRLFKKLWIRRRPRRHDVPWFQRDDLPAEDPTDADLGPINLNEIKDILDGKAPKPQRRRDSRKAGKGDQRRQPRYQTTKQTNQKNNSGARRGGNSVTGLGKSDLPPRATGNSLAPASVETACNKSNTLPNTSSLRPAHPANKPDAKTKTLFPEITPTEEITAEELPSSSTATRTLAANSFQQSARIATNAAEQAGAVNPKQPAGVNVNKKGHSSNAAKLPLALVDASALQSKDCEEKEPLGLHEKPDD